MPNSPALRARPRRGRATAGRRRLLRETDLTARRLVLPVFVADGPGIDESIASLPGHFRSSPDRLVERLRPVADRLGGVILFGVPTRKDPTGSATRDPEGPLARGLASLKTAYPHLPLFADICLCGATDHGHCGVLVGEAVENDATLPLLAESAVVAARAGADYVAPSSMMDGQVAAIRHALDQSGQGQVGILAYAAKFASAWYGPFRDAARSAPAAGDRRSYQLDPANGREGLREVRRDEEEGADLVMVKPAGPYLDVIREVRASTALPVVGYQVSGEYSAVRAAAERGWLDERSAALELLTGIRRAGADLIITYWAVEAVRWLEDDR